MSSKAGVLTQQLAFVLPPQIIRFRDLLSMPVAELLPSDTGPIGKRLIKIWRTAPECDTARLAFVN
jgi:hypothetical protein